MNANALTGIGMKAVSKIASKVAPHSPKIALVVGGACIIGGVVAACKATIKAQEVAEERKENLELVESTENEEEKKQALIATNTKTVAGYVKCYAGSVILIAVGMGLIIWSNGKLTKTNIGLAAALATEQKISNYERAIFAEYRDRVINEFGKEKDAEIISGINEVSVKEGTEFNRKFIGKLDSNGHGFARYGKELSVVTSDQFINVEGYNEHFVAGQEAIFNNLIQSKKRPSGKVSLLEVYRALGFEPECSEESDEWSVMGWDVNSQEFEGIQLRIIKMDDIGYGRRFKIIPNVQSRPIVWIPAGCFR